MILGGKNTGDCLNKYWCIILRNAVNKDPTSYADRKYYVYGAS